MKATGIIVPGMTLSAIVMKYRLRGRKKKSLKNNSLTSIYTFHGNFHIRKIFKEVNIIFF